MQNLTSDNRIPLFDNLKFLLIVFVVIGHFAELYASQSDDFRRIYLFIYAFHMPLFVFLSGLFHRNQGIVKKVVTYSFLGFLLKIVFFLESTLLYGKGSFSMLSDGGIPWFMFALPICICISYLLRDVNKWFVLIFSLLLGCFSGYDASIGDYLYLSRVIVFYPFYVMGEMVGTDTVLQVRQSKPLKAASCLILITWGLLCLFKLDDLYALKALFSGRNPFSVNGLFTTWGFIYRIICYGISLLTGFSLICLVPNNRLPAITTFGSRTLQVYFWHWPVAYTLIKLNIPAILCATAGGKLVYLLLAVALSFILSFKLFEFPVRQVTDINRTGSLSPPKRFEQEQ